MKGSWQRTLAWIAGILGAIGLLFYLFVFDVWVVPRGPDGQFATSIMPTLTPADKVLVQRGRVPRYGELARCLSPLVTNTFVVGRVFGEPGDRVEVSDRTITTNNRPLASRHQCPPVTVVHPATEGLVTLNCGVAETGAWTFSYLFHNEQNGGGHSAIVEAGKLYLVSDNRLLHQDSRDFGQVDAATCEHLVFRLWGESFTDSSRRFNLLW